MVADAVAVLDEVGVGAAHVVGVSMGGGLAQEVVLCHPDRVRALTLISTTLVTGGVDPPGPAVAMTDPPEPDWLDDDAVVEYLVEAQRMLAAEPFDDEECRAVARTAVSRTTNNESSQKNHQLVEESGPPPRGLSDITVPTVVLHGDVDPLFPPPHGEALARAIPNARLVVLPGTGHEFPRRNWPAVLAEVRAVEHR